jgi:type IV pilus assembly protein PilB
VTHEADQPHPTPPTPPARVGEALLHEGLISREELESALAEQRHTGRLLGEVLVSQGVVPAPVLVRALARRLGIKGCHLRHGLIDPALLKLIGPEEAERLKVIPMFRVRGVLTVAMAEPQSLPTIDRLRGLTGLKIRPVLALEENILEFVHKYATGDVNVDEFLASLAESNVEVIESESSDDRSTTDLDKMVAGSPIVNLINVALLTAIKAGASDIHIEPTERGTRIRQRIDGVLRELMNPPPGMHAAIASRVKVIGKMDIAERRLPQEGRVHIIAEGREIDVRVSSIPTLLGEKLVLRILDKSNLKVRMEDLGMQPAALEAFKRVLSRPHGLTLVTGPTGSGKTTTLYSALDLLRGPEHNLVTVEDPVEYRLDLVNQIQVAEPIGLTFARVLRSVLRQDPDVIMVGEIRDEETARVAVQAALTGHIVLATLHTNDAPGAVARLLDMGIEAYLLSGAIQGAVAQRLTRTICQACATNYYPSEAVLHDAGLDSETSRPFRRGEGCRQCHDSGFAGRVGIYEVMEISTKIRRMIHSAAPTHRLRAELRRIGCLSLREEGVQLALAGKTSLEEVLRVTHMDDGEDRPAEPVKDSQGDPPARARTRAGSKAGPKGGDASPPAKEAA